MSEQASEWVSDCVCVHVPWSFMLSMMVISLFSLAIDSLSFPLLMKSGLIFTLVTRNHTLHGREEEVG